LDFGELNKLHYNFVASRQLNGIISKKHDFDLLIYTDLYVTEI